MIPPVMNRQMFNQARPQLQAPQMSMTPQAQAQIQMAEKQASAEALAGIAQGVENLNQELDNAENYTGVIPDDRIGYITNNLLRNDGYNVKKGLV